MNVAQNMILSASGWRKVFAKSGNEQDFSNKISCESFAASFLAAEAFANYLAKKIKKRSPQIVVARDTRPTGAAICRAVLKALKSKNFNVKFLGVSAAPEIMAYSKNADGFVYVSASHNPVGHNGIKFGLNNGGVLEAEENADVKKIFLSKARLVESPQVFLDEREKIDESDFYDEQEIFKNEALAAYEKFSLHSISAIQDKKAQKIFFKKFDSILKKRKIGVVCDFNGSARAASIDKKFFEKHGINFYPINDAPGLIEHEIIPEGENLECAKYYLQKIRATCSNIDVNLAYACDCDGDRGNLVYWSEREKNAKTLCAQDTFALSVLAELSFSLWLGGRHAEKLAVAANCPTSMRIEEIAETFGAKVFRAEVGEANVVNLARDLRKRGYNARILGEGSNGGTIVHPAAVRDPLNMIFSVLKLLCLKDALGKNGKLKKGLFHIWCEKRGIPYSENFSLDDILDSLPAYATTGVSEARAVLKISALDTALLKKNFQKEFELSFAQGANGLLKKYGIESWKAAITSGTKEIFSAKDFSLYPNGGLKIMLFRNDQKEAAAFFWMRKSGTENAFRILCDVRGKDKKMEEEILAWEAELIMKAQKA